MTFEPKSNKAILLATVFLMMAPMASSIPAFAQEAAAQEDAHGDEHGAEEGAEENAVKMNAAERKKLGVEVQAVSLRSLSEEISAPGEVLFDQYQSSQITPRIPAQILTRHVQLGDHVSVGDKLVTLSSVQMAEAQGALIVATREWKRVKNLGKKVVSDRRYVEAQVMAQQAKAKVLAFGMTANAADQLAASGDATKAVGAFTLFARQNGTIMNDKFVAGEFVSPGRVLFEITDESNVWVEARLSADEGSRIKPGTAVRIQTSGGASYPGSVLQVRHQMDETTRTLSARISVDNISDSLHAGEFVTAYIETGASGSVLAIPQQAVTLMGGQTQVFVLHGKDELEATPISLGQTRGLWVEVKSGLSRDDQIAVSQIFKIKSQILKSKMGGGHGH